MRNYWNKDLLEIFDFISKKFFFGLVALFFFVPFNMYGKKYDDIFIKADISKENPFVDEAIVITYNLYSKFPEIQYAKRASESELKKGTSSFFSPVEVNSRGRRIIMNNEEYFVFPLERYIVSFDSKGTYSYEGGAFDIGLQKTVVYDDPFWGRRRGYKTENVRLEVDEPELKVKNRPSNHNLSITGSSVGNYKITVSLPPGDIILNRPARAIITLKGKGLLDDNILPQYNDAFHGKGIRLKSMSESRNRYFDGNDVVSELILDCEFIPAEKDVEIGKIYFDFFNSETGKYERVQSEPVRVKVKSIKSEVETTEI